VPVIDLRRILGLAGKAPQPSEHLIIVHTETRLVAIRADRAIDVRQIEPEMVQAMPDAFEGAGIIRMPDGLVMVLDAMGLDAVIMAASSKGERLDAALVARDRK
jgi:chemotaxis signal transduction protein